jgi:hypothetical protein
MPRRALLSALERDRLLAVPDDRDELIRHYTLSEHDHSLIRQRRGDANRLGFAVQLCLLRYPGQGLVVDAAVPSALLTWIGRQLDLAPACWAQYSQREETRREHLLELRAYLGLTPFSRSHFRQAVRALTAVAMQTDKGVVLAGQALDHLRRQHVIIPSIEVVERVCAEALTHANRPHLPHPDRRVVGGSPDAPGRPAPAPTRQHEHVVGVAAPIPLQSQCPADVGTH